MTPETAEALEKSIAKWEKNARVRRAGNAHLSVSQCPLCVLFYENDCKGCPVAEKTGTPFCVGTPYGEADVAHAEWRWNNSPEDKAMFIKAAKVMAEFLKSLRPVK